MVVMLLISLFVSFVSADDFGDRVKFLKKRIKVERLSEALKRRLDVMEQEGEYIPKESVQKKIRKSEKNKKVQVKKKMAVKKDSSIKKRVSISKQIILEGPIVKKTGMDIEEYKKINKDFYQNKKDILSIHRDLYLKFK